MRGLVLATLIVAALPLAAHAEQVVLSCSGDTRDLLPGGGMSEASPLAFEIAIDLENQTVQRNGKAMVVREVTDDKIVYSYRKGALSVLLSDAVTTLSRKTGVWRNQYGSGTCKVQETKNLF